MPVYIFKRYEKKYIITPQQKEKFLEILSHNTIPDRHGESDICNIYFDTPDYRIIRASIQKPPYKEKLRLRCYGVPDESKKCFLELKKKYKGVVYKRRISADYITGFSYLSGKDANLPDSQIKNEIDYFREFYNYPQPRMNILYRRTAYYDKNDDTVRFTFDSDILSRSYDLDLRNGIYGERILQKELTVLEIKTSGAVPLWVADGLSSLKIYPTSFSKYGTAYIKSIGGKTNAN